MRQVKKKNQKRLLFDLWSKKENAINWFEWMLSKKNGSRINWIEKNNKKMSLKWQTNTHVDMRP